MAVTLEKIQNDIQTFLAQDKRELINTQLYRQGNFSTEAYERWKTLLIEVLANNAEDNLKKIQDLVSATFLQNLQHTEISAENLTYINHLCQIYFGSEPAPSLTIDEKALFPVKPTDQLDTKVKQLGLYLSALMTMLKPVESLVKTNQLRLVNNEEAALEVEQDQTSKAFIIYPISPNQLALRTSSLFVRLTQSVGQTFQLGEEKLSFSLFESAELMEIVKNHVPSLGESDVGAQGSLSADEKPIQETVESTGSHDKAEISQGPASNVKVESVSFSDDDDVVSSLFSDSSSPAREWEFTDKFTETDVEDKEQRVEEEQDAKFEVNEAAVKSTESSGVQMPNVELQADAAAGMELAKTGEDTTHDVEPTELKEPMIMEIDMAGSGSEGIEKDDKVLTPVVTTSHVSIEQLTEVSGDQAPVELKASNVVAELNEAVIMEVDEVDIEEAKNSVDLATDSKEDGSEDSEEEILDSEEEVVYFKEERSDEKPLRAVSSEQESQKVDRSLESQSAHSVTSKRPSLQRTTTSMLATPVVPETTLQQQSPNSEIPPLEPVTPIAEKPKPITSTSSSTNEKTNDSSSQKPLDALQGFLATPTPPTPQIFEGSSKQQPITPLAQAQVQKRKAADEVKKASNENVKGKVEEVELPDVKRKRTSELNEQPATQPSELDKEKYIWDYGIDAVRNAAKSIAAQAAEAGRKMLARKKASF